jgi:hypothetical protein
MVFASPTGRAWESAPVFSKSERNCERTVARDTLRSRTHSLTGACTREPDQSSELLVEGGRFGELLLTFDPKVAYTRSGGNAASLVLANEDGSGAVNVCTSKKALGPIDSRSGGGQIAFAEQGAAGWW